MTDELNRLKAHTHSALIDGWMPQGGITWTYASASTFTVAGDVTAFYKAGTRLKWTQSTVKYGVVVSSTYSSPNTTVTIAVNTDYVITNAAISANSISYANPPDYPGWFNYTPTLTGFSVDPANSIYRYYPRPGMIKVFARQVINGTSNATSFSISAPVNCVSITNGVWQAVGMGTDNGTILTTPALVQIAAAAAGTIACYKNWAAGAWTASGGKRIIFQIEYEW